MKRLKCPKGGLWATLVASFFFLLGWGCQAPLLQGFSGSSIHGALKNLNPDSQGDPWLVSVNPPMSGRAVSGSLSDLSFEGGVLARTLPARVDNSASKYFRPIFVQSGGSCAQASGVGYIFTYEMDADRDLDATLSANQYPTHFTYNFLNGGDNGAATTAVSGWEILRDLGCPTVATYGGMYDEPAIRWISGYDAYYQAMQNRVGEAYVVNLSTAQGINALRNWLYDYGTGAAHGGLASFGAGAVTSFEHLPADSPNPLQCVVVAWGTVVNHAMTIVGYDDTIHMDLNSDGRYTNDVDINRDGVVDVRDWEVGGFLVANSWGTSWGNQGKVYMLYKTAAETLAHGGIDLNAAYVVRGIPSTQPLLTMRATFFHSARNSLTISAGVSQNMAAAKPDTVQTFTAFTKRGGALPVQGINGDPIEIGLDLTPLLTNLDFTKPARFFFQVNELDSNNYYSGAIQNVSVVNPLTSQVWDSGTSNVAIGNNTTTRIPVTVGTLPNPSAPPQVQFLSPTVGESLAGTVEVDLSVASSAPLAAWSLSVDGAVLGGGTLGPYLWNLDTTALSEGAHIFLAQATDAQGRIGSATVNVNVSNQVVGTPTVTILSPGSGATVAGIQRISVTTSGTGDVAKVVFFIDGVRQAVVRQLPYEWNWDTGTVVNGSHKILVRVVDTVGNAYPESLNVTVAN